MPKEILIETKLKLSKTFRPGVSEVRFGKYTLKPVPSFESSEAVLVFIDSYEGPKGGGSHPEEETSIVMKFLALVFNSRISKRGTRINNIDIPDIKDREMARYRDLIGNLDETLADRYMGKLLLLDSDLARQFVRACHCYSFALEFVPSDPTFAFFLLVVSIECLSSQDKVIPHKVFDMDKRKCDRFCQFISNFLPDREKGPDEQNTDLFTELLKTTYYSHRSGFAHGGKEVSEAALLADKAGSSYLKHLLGGKETKTPGLAWFTRIVRASLLGYLDNIAGSAPDGKLLSALAFEKSGLNLKAKKALGAGQVVTFDDVEYR